MKRLQELAAIILVLLAVVGTPVAAQYYQNSMLPASTGAAMDLEAWAPENGNWGQPVITVKQGERVRLRLFAQDVSHGFAIPQLGVESGIVEPGKPKVVEFTADRPGRFSYHCTVVCGVKHRDMVGVIEVRS